MPSEFCAATSVTEIESPFEIAFLSSLLFCGTDTVVTVAVTKDFGVWEPMGCWKCITELSSQDLAVHYWVAGKFLGQQGCRVTGPESISRNHPDQPQPTSSQLLYLLGVEILQQEGFYKCLTVWNFCILPSMELTYKRSFLNEKSASLILLFCLMKNRLEISF